MNKKLIIVLSLILAFNTTACFAESWSGQNTNAARREHKKKTHSTKQTTTTQTKSSKSSQQQNNGPFSSYFDTETEYYPNASLSSAITKYRAANYSGCLQELFSYVQHNPADAVAYYYIAMSYAQVGDKNAAAEAYEQVIKLSSDRILTEYATKGKDCMTNGPTCVAESIDEAVNSGDKKSDGKAVDDTAQKEAELDNFINAPYGNGLSPELDKQLKEEKLKRIQQSINKNENLDGGDVERIKDFDINNSSQSEETYKLASAEPSDKEILKAIKTLRDAGVSVNIQPEQTSETDNISTSVTQDTIETPQIVETQTPVNPVNTAEYIDPQYAQMSLMLGNNNNNYNNNMMNMIPFLMQQNQSGQNIDPQLMQAIMMQQMMPTMDFGLSNK